MSYGIGDFMLPFPPPLLYMIYAYYTIHIMQSVLYDLNYQHFRNYVVSRRDILYSWFLRDQGLPSLILYFLRFEINIQDIWHKNTFFLLTQKQ